jgi:hypothetical protein
MEGRMAPELMVHVVVYLLFVAQAQQPACIGMLMQGGRSF